MALSSCNLIGEIDRHPTLDQVIRLVPGSRRILRRLGFLPEVEGSQSWSDLCAARGLEPETVITLLNVLAQSERRLACSCSGLMTLTELCDHLEERHRLLDEALAKASLSLHGEAGERIRILSRKILNHLRNEANRLFPLIRALQRALSLTREDRTELELHLQHAWKEHGALEEELSELEALTETQETDSGYDRECRRTALNDLTEVLHGQIYEENQVLYRRAAVVARSL